MFCCSIKDPHPPYISPEPFPDLVSPDEIELPISNADDLSTKPRTLRESVQHQWVRNMASSDWRRLIAHYHGLVAHVDTEVGRLLDQLALNGLADDTIVVLLSDHGENMGAHRMIEKGPSMYEESIGIPFVMRWPGHIDAGRTSDALFSTVDLVATLGDLCDVCVNDGVGMNFADVLVSGDPGPRDAIFSEFYSHFADQHQFVKTVRTDRWKLNLFLLDESELYDLHDDPDEMTNLIGSESLAATRAELLDRIVDWCHQTEDPLAPIVARSARRLSAGDTAVV
jgi:arylsulfatase A-like enzyme